MADSDWITNDCGDEYRNIMTAGDWQIIQLRRIHGLLASCPWCGFVHSCSTDELNEEGNWELQYDETKVYPYCPMCGHDMDLFDSALPVQVEATRKKRRRNKALKDKRLRNILKYASYPPPGYIDGEYIKSLGQSNRKQFYKNQSNRAVRRHMSDYVSKGNAYRKEYEYWWTLD